MKLIFPMLLLALLPAARASAQQLVKPDANAPENAARKAVIDSLDALAAKQTAARRTEIAQIHTLAQAKARQQKVHATMLRLLGLLPARTPLNPQMLGEISIPGARIQKILFDSQPNFHVTALLYLPEPAPAGKLPAIVMAPGHGATGKAGDFAFAAAFTRAGFAVLSYDPIGQGERLQYPDPADPTKSLATRPTGEHSEASLQPILLAESLGKYMLWDGMRAVDYLETRPEIDPKRIGAFGCSGGGAMTALLGALDTLIAATGTACYITSFDTLLPSIGPQDGEQSTPGWIAAGLDFADWIEVAAPRPYAIIATESDMFPFAGAQSTEAEARSFYSLFPPLGLSSRSAAEGSASASASLAFIHGPGGHGNLRPIQSQILGFFEQHLMPVAPPTATASSSARARSMDPQGRELPPPGAMQVTKTGQVSTAYPGSATVFSLNFAHAKATVRQELRAVSLEIAVRQLTHASASPSAYHGVIDDGGDAIHSNGVQYTNSNIPAEPGIGCGIQVAAPLSKSRHPASLILTATQPGLDGRVSSTNQIALATRDRLLLAGDLVISMPAMPSPPGTEEQKSPILGDFYMLNLRAELVGKTLLGMRVDSVIRCIDALASRPDVDPNNITAEASGHEALVLLHAAILDPRLKHITLTNLPPTYRERLAEPLPKNLPEDLIPGVLLHYDIPDLVRALGTRVNIQPPT